MEDARWNKCDVCGRFISFNDFEKGLAKRTMSAPDSAYSSESHETLCKNHTHEVAKEG
jgi:hypothetical protein